MSVISLKYKTKAGTLAAPGDVDPGAFIPIATTTLSTATATITFSAIPQNYEHLQIRAISRTTYAGIDSPVNINFNSDSGSNYTLHYIRGDGSAASSYGSANMTNAESQRIAGSTAGTNVFGCIVTDILDYANTNKYKTIKNLGGYDNNGSGYIYLNSGLWRSTSAINAISLTTYNNFAQYSSFALYGIKRAGA